MQTQSFILILSLVYYRACLEVYLCIVFTHASFHRIHLCVYIYIYTYVYYIFIYVTFVDPCTCGNEQGKTKNRSNFALSQDKTLRIEYNSHITHAQARTHAESGVQYTQVCTRVESDSQSFEGKAGKGGVLQEGARVAMRTGSG